MGALSDRVGRRPLLITFGALSALTTVPFMTILSRTTDFALAFAVVMTALVIISCYTAISGVVKAELFPTEVRALGVGFPYAIAVSLFGGTAEYVALSFKAADREPWYYWYVTLCVTISLCIYLGMKEPKDHSAIENVSLPPAAPPGAPLDDPDNGKVLTRA